ncbi:MAG: hypothetical protein E7574_01215 [Ruminococcaceae bacterium]|nr:hypothetical protein [Oscillospiraceae bacterium]
MEKVTKQILTRKFIKGELSFYNTADMRVCWVYLGLLVFVGGFIVFFINIIESGKDAAISTNVILLFLCIPAALIIYSFVLCLKRKKMLENDEFDILTDEVSYKTEEYRRRGRRSSYEEVIYFKTFGRVSVSHTTYQLASNDDMFYMVAYRFRKPQLVLFYSSKIYEYKEK